MAATDCYPTAAPAHAAHSPGFAHGVHPHTAAHHAGHGVGTGAHGHAHVLGQHAAVPHLPVFGPPLPPVAVNCVRIPGALPAGPGLAAAPGGSPLGALGRAFYDQGLGSASSAGPAAAAASTALGIAKAALVAGSVAAASLGAAGYLAPSGGNSGSNTGGNVGLLYGTDNGGTGNGTGGSNGGMPGNIVVTADMALGSMSPGNIGPGNMGVDTPAADTRPDTSGTKPDTGVTPLGNMPTDTNAPSVAVPEPDALYIFAFGAVAAFVARHYASKKSRRSN